MKDRPLIIRNERLRATALQRILSLDLSKPWAMTLEVYKRNRSLEQNKFMWGTVYKAISIETGHTEEEIHDWCREEFLPRRFVEINGKVHEARKSTAGLKVDEMSTYLNQVIAWAQRELGIILPAFEYEDAA